MKKISAIILALCVCVSLLSACGKKDTNSDIETNTINSTSRQVKIDSTAFDNGVVLKAENYTDEKIDKLFFNAEKTETYELTAKLGDEKVQPNGDVNVCFPIPKEYDESVHNIVVFYIDNDYNAELLKSVIKGELIEVKLSHFSLYSISIIKKEIYDTVVSEITKIATETPQINSDISTPSTDNKLSSQVNSTSQADIKSNKDAAAKKKTEEQAKAEEEAKKKVEEEKKAQAERDAKNPLKSLKYDTWYCFTDNNVTAPYAKIKAVLIIFYKDGTGMAGLNELTDKIIPEVTSDDVCITINNIPYYECAGLGGPTTFEITDTKITLSYCYGAQTVTLCMNENSELLVVENNVENSSLFEKNSLFKFEEIKFK